MSAGVSTPSTGSKVFALGCTVGKGDDVENGVNAAVFAVADDVLASEGLSSSTHTAAPM